MKDAEMNQFTNKESGTLSVHELNFAKVCMIIEVGKGSKNSSRDNWPMNWFVKANEYLFGKPVSL